MEFVSRGSIGCYELSVIRITWWKMSLALSLAILYAVQDFSSLWDIIW